MDVFIALVGLPGAVSWKKSNQLIIKTFIGNQTFLWWYSSSCKIHQSWLRSYPKHNQHCLVWWISPEDVISCWTVLVVVMKRVTLFLLGDVIISSPWQKPFTKHRPPLREFLQARYFFVSSFFWKMGLKSASKYLRTHSNFECMCRETGVQTCEWLCIRANLIVPTLMISIKYDLY